MEHHVADPSIVQAEHRVNPMDWEFGGCAFARRRGACTIEAELIINIIRWGFLIITIYLNGAQDPILVST